MDDAALSLWLRLREQRDWKARSVSLTNAILARLPDDRPVGVIDLATGAGSNLRYLVERLPPRQRWLLIDRSAALLSEAGTRTRAWAAERGYDVELRTAASMGLAISGPQLDCEVEARVQNLATLDDPSMFAGRHLVTASALLDLVSEAWLRALALRCRAAGAAALLTISYDGRSSCAPVEPEDEFVRELMNAHQRRDKGLGGPAQGPNAASCAARCFADEGFEVEIAASDWQLDSSDAAMQRTLIDGWARAASEQAPAAGETIAAWRTRRLAHVDAGISHVVVGHQDVAAWPGPR
jgi:hypothetical protein